MTEEQDKHNGTRSESDERPEVDPHVVIHDIITCLEAHELHPLDAVEILAWCIGIAVDVAHECGLPADKLPMLESDISDRIHTAIAAHVDGYGADKPKSSGAIFVPQNQNKIYTPN